MLSQSSTYPCHGPRWSGNGAWTGSIQTSTFVPAGVGGRTLPTGDGTGTARYRARTSSNRTGARRTGRPSTCSRSSPNTRGGSGSRLRRRGSLYDGYSGWSDEHAPPHFAVEISSALDRTIVLTAIIFQLNPDPIAGREVSLAHEADNGIPAIGELDGLPNRNFRHIGQYPEGINASCILCSRVGRWPRGFMEMEATW